MFVALSAVKFAPIQANQFGQDWPMDGVFR